MMIVLIPWYRAVGVSRRGFCYFGGRGGVGFGQWKAPGFSWWPGACMVWWVRLMGRIGGLPLILVQLVLLTVRFAQESGMGWSHWVLLVGEIRKGPARGQQGHSGGGLHLFGVAWSEAPVSSRKARASVRHQAMVCDCQFLLAGVTLQRFVYCRNPCVRIVGFPPAFRKG